MLQPQEVRQFALASSYSPRCFHAPRASTSTPSSNWSVFTLLGWLNCVALHSAPIAPANPFDRQTSMSG